jgi:hypothetical protein
MARSRKRRLDDKTPTPPKTRSPRSKRIKARHIPPKPDFEPSGTDSDTQALPPTATSYRIVIASDTSEDTEDHDGSSAQAQDPQAAGEQHRPQPRVYTFASSSSSSDLDMDNDAATGPFAKSFVRTTSRELCSMKANVVRRQRYAEDKLLAKARSTSNDLLLMESAKTKVGAKAMPLYADALRKKEHYATLTANTKNLLSSVGRRHHREVAKRMTSGLPKSFLKAELGMSDTQAKRAQSTQHLTPMQEALAVLRSTSNANYAEGTDRTSRNIVSEGETMAYKTFFFRTTHQASGADVSRSRILDRTYTTWGADLSAQWPGLLREVAEYRPDLLPDMKQMPKTGWSKFEASMLSAVHACPDDPVAERKDRHAKYLENYRMHLARKGGRLPKCTDAQLEERSKHEKAQIAARVTPGAFDPETYTVTAPMLDTFRAWLTVSEHRYTLFSVPHPCPLCLAGPVDELVYAALHKDLVQLVTDGLPVPPELTQRVNRLRASLRMYRVHVRQLQECRAAVQKTEEELQPGTAMIIRDFVNHHDHSGSHVKCLHWVLAWRDKVGEPLKRLKLRHYCSDPASMSTDGYFQADVSDFHFSEDNLHCPGLMKNFHTIIIVGDHGPHFSSHETMHNESTILRRYGKIIKLMFLASYHAYSRADGSGAEDATDLHRDMMAGFPRNGAGAMKDMTNSSNDVTSWAYEFPAINRSSNIFPPDKHFQAKDRAKWIRKWTEVTFIHPAAEARYDGILQYRLVTGMGDWQWTDLVAATRGEDDTLCDHCSTKQNETVFHMQADCPAPAYIHNLPVFVDLQPDPARITGVQSVRKKKIGGKAAPVRYPCKFVGCPAYANKRKAMQSATAANRHMQLVHEPTDAEYATLAYPDGASTPVLEPARKPKKRGRPPKPKTGVEQSKENPLSSDEESDEKEHSHADDEAPIVSTSEDEPDANDTSGDSNEDDDDQNPDEMIDHGDQDVVENIVDHKLWSCGKYKYKIKWAGYERLTWEWQKGVHKALRKDYHKALQEEEASAARLAEARLAQGGRKRRSGPGDAASKEEHRARVDARTGELQASGSSYYKAFEQAQRELGIVG